MLLSLPVDEARRASIRSLRSGMKGAGERVVGDSDKIKAVVFKSTAPVGYPR